MQPLWRLRALFLCFCLLVPTVSYGKNWYVVAGKDGEGTKEDPLGSIGDALLQANSGDVIHVAAGVYYGEGGAGKWLIRKPNITIVGGYNSDFSERNPFRYHTILMRSLTKTFSSLAECQRRKHEKYHSLEVTKAPYNSAPMIQGSTNPRESHHNTILDGLIIDGHTRNLYKPNGDLSLRGGPVGTPLVMFRHSGCKIRNCILLNGSGRAISIGVLDDVDPKDPAHWSVVENCIILNCLQGGIEVLAGRGRVVVKNNTLAFFWMYRGFGHGLIVGQNVRVTAQNNIFAYASGYGVTNLRGNKKLRLIDNVFWNNTLGHYTYFSSRTRASFVEDKVSKLKGRMAKKKYSLSKKSKGNREADPQFRPDPQFFLRFTNQIKAKGGGKVRWDKVNKLRRMLGLPLAGTQGSGPVNYGVLYEFPYIFLFSSNPALKGIGAQKDVKFPVYFSKSKRVDKNYQAIEYGDLKGGKLYDTIRAKGARGMDVEITLELLRRSGSGGFYAPGVSRKSHELFMTKDRWLYLYVPKGSAAQEALREAQREGVPVVVRGTVYDVSATMKSRKRVAIVVDDAEVEEED